MLIRIRNRRRENPETEWGHTAGRDSRSWVVWLMSGLLLLLAGGAFLSGNLRLLEIVGTPEGPKVDWDAYARYGSASWEDLWSGAAERAVGRVFCEPSTERPEPFENQAKWTCFRMSGPELPRAALGFAAVGSLREAKMKQVVLGTPNYRQRFTLEIVRHEGKDRAAL